VAAKLHALCTDKYRNDKLMKEALLLLQRVGENRPAMNASLPAGNNGCDARDGTGATRSFQCGEPLCAARSLAIVYCDEMLVNLAQVVSRSGASKHCPVCGCRFSSSRHSFASLL